MQDERHAGLGADVPCANRVAPLNRTVGSCDDWDDGEGDVDVDGDEDGDVGGFEFGVRRLSFYAGEGGAGAEGAG